MSSFDCFIVVPPGAEHWASLELLEHWPVQEDGQLKLPTLKLFSGGVEFRAPLEYLSILHHQLRLPVRILVRISEGPVQTWEELWDHLDQISWQKFFAVPPPAPKLHISARSSQLFHRQQLSERSERWFNKKFGKSNPSATVDIYLRLFRDKLTVSLDASGEPLFKRGIKQQVGKAPLRENLAHLMVKMVTRGLSPEVLKSFQLVDPFAGSGTLLLESLGAKYSMPKREFAYQLWPCVQAEKLWSSPYAGDSTLFGSYVAYEWDKSQYKELTENFDKFRDQELDVALFNENSLESTLPLPGGLLGRILVANPPFGGRIKASSGATKDLIKLLERFKPLRSAFLMPESWGFLESLRSLPEYKVMDQLSLDHGGLKVKIVVVEMDTSLALGPIPSKISPNQEI